MDWKCIREFLLGKPLNPLQPGSRRHVLLISFLAWVGLGADGLSSSCYGPEEAYLALGEHSFLALYLALATALTVFIIALGYNQVIELFPSGGGGYKVSSTLLGPSAGLTSGVALIVDYMLTIAISIAAGVDALFSILDVGAQNLKLVVELGLVFLLMLLNLRGIKEPIKVLMPIFIAFCVAHFVLIVYGIYAQSAHLAPLVAESVRESVSLGESLGWFFVASLFLRAYSLGGGTYTGIEAVSNNVNILVEPRVHTGKLTMFYMAASLAFTAGGIILLYLLWDVQPMEGQTLNAIAFRHILDSLNFSNPYFTHILLVIILGLEACLLFVGANTGFMDGPAVLCNMAADEWVPGQFRHLSSRLVAQNGIWLMGLSSLIILLATRGDVHLLVVMYSINVFLTFSLSLFGLCVYWWRHRAIEKAWRRRGALALLGFIVCISILIVTTIEKFMAGGWITILITASLAGLCILVKKHYKHVFGLLEKISKQFESHKRLQADSPPVLDPHKSTAIIFINKSIGMGMHTLLRLQWLFPNQYQNFVFVSVGEVDVQSFIQEKQMKLMQKEVEGRLDYFVNYCHSLGLPAASYHSYGSDIIENLLKLALKVKKLYPGSVFFCGTLVFENENWVTHWLHNHTATLLQHKLHRHEIPMVLLPLHLL